MFGPRAIHMPRARLPPSQVRHKCSVALRDAFAPMGWATSQVACGSGLELIYDFLRTDERANRPELLARAGSERKVTRLCEELVSGVV